MNNIAKEIKKVNIEEELQKSYLDYAMSVIIGRALPDVRDGLKPVHRRILFAMNILHNKWNTPYKKSARIVGDVIGKYHPHGDSAVYDAIVRMAQQFSLRYPLIDGQGNFGSIDGDSAAAMRYTEIRMSKIAHEMLNDLEKNTVNFVLNYDGTEKIPEILPTKIPNLLINGSSGIAVGMATNIPPHNLQEVINGCIAYLKNPFISLKKLMKYIPGPDFPTAGIIHGKNGIQEAYRTGKGKISIRSKHSIEYSEKNKKESLIIYELPYQVNKSKLIEKIALLVKEKKILGISAIRDESDKDGMRIVIEIKKDFIAKVVLHQLYTLTSLQTSFGINMVALSSGQPKTMGLKKILKEFIRHRKKIITRKCLFKLNKYTKKIHVLEGFYIALNNIDKIIEVIKIARNSKNARKNLEKIKWKKNTTIHVHRNICNNAITFNFSKKQTQAILNIKLNKLTTLETNNIYQKYKSLLKKKSILKKILSSSNQLKKIIKQELLKIKNQFSDLRRTKIIKKTSEINMEDMIIQESVVVTLSHSGYVKYQPISDYNAQKRGGKGKSAAKTTDEDYIENLLVANSHDTILCFSSRGLLYWMKVYQLPETSRHARGRPIINLLPLTQKERITTILPISEYKSSINIFMATALGFVKKTSLDQFKKPRNSGIIAINLRKNDELIGVSLTNGKNNILLFTSKGKVVRFSETKIRKMGRTAAGIKGIKIIKNDRVVSLLVPKTKDDILIVTENGYGKRTKINHFPVKSRATKGVISIRVTPKNGVVIGAIQVDNYNQIMMITNAGTLVRTRVSEIATLQRNTQGVILIRTAKKEKVVGLQKLSYTPLIS
ncbi:DNA gyrase subunit A [Buchnera aphidicola]|uniref:DNA gyrase subunit A n=1 Tax=Buchnera aphidicola (Cinara cf. splendens/pseudotsugae 3390) TaxID=2518980 RepID=A0A451CWH9_9GAMM|nr:DNA gyrase subunit A [Buchnera aphidicola]VFP77694.1 DNA gyrase subunit A [Buchnera aphidicola (Cinara cf. splendens/pseudotsugae 3390)]